MTIPNTMQCLSIRYYYYHRHIAGDLYSMFVENGLSIIGEHHQTGFDARVATVSQPICLPRYYIVWYTGRLSAIACRVAVARLLPQTAQGMPPPMHPYSFNIEAPTHAVPCPARFLDEACAADKVRHREVQSTPKRCSSRA